MRARDEKLRADKQELEQYVHLVRAPNAVDATKEGKDTAAKEKLKVPVAAPRHRHPRRGLQPQLPARRGAQPRQERAQQRHFDGCTRNNSVFGEF